MKRILLPAVVLLFVPCLTRSAGDAPLDRATLKGIAAVGIVVDTIDLDLQKLGVTQDVLAARMEGKLNDANVKVDKTSPEFIAIRITQAHASRGPFALSVTAGLYQPVTLTRSPTVKTATQTWEVESVLMADPKQVQSASLETVDELADRFVKAYRQANPQ
jgi:hypothetical protein